MGQLTYCFALQRLNEDMTMTNFDFSPLYRTTVGFDHLSTLLDNIHRSDRAANSYPPYNIELISENNYQITMAVSGFNSDELDIKSEHRTLTVKGQKHPDQNTRNYLHQGIAARNFERKFQLAEHIEITGAQLENGLLHIDLAREIPEAMKPKSIPINDGKGRLMDVRREGAAA
jgi:molecular chaperone IbpA